VIMIAIADRTLGLLVIPLRHIQYTATASLRAIPCRSCVLGGSWHLAVRLQNWCLLPRVSPVSPVSCADPSEDSACV
jgi:hypothetical protein